MLYVRTDIQVNRRKFHFLKIDLKHINKGGRSNFSPEDVGSIVESLLDGSILERCGETHDKLGDRVFFVEKGTYRNKPF